MDSLAHRYFHFKSYLYAHVEANPHINGHPGDVTILRDHSFHGKCSMACPSHGLHFPALADQRFLAPLISYLHKGQNEYNCLTLFQLMAAAMQPVVQMQLIVPIIAKINITCRRKRLGSFPHYKRKARGECSNLGIHFPNQLHMQRPLCPLAVPKIVRFFCKDCINRRVHSEDVLVRFSWKLVALVVKMTPT